MKRIYQGVDIDEYYQEVIKECRKTPTCNMCGYTRICEKARCCILSVSKEEFIKRLEDYIRIEEA